MDKICMVLGGLMLAFSSLAVEPAKVVKVAMAGDAAQPQARAVKSVKAPKAKGSKQVDEGDSRLNDYRLERESCCGPQ